MSSIWGTLQNSYVMAERMLSNICFVGFIYMHAVSTIKKMELLFIYDKNSFQKLFFAGNAYRKSIPLMMFIEQINP